MIVECSKKGVSYDRENRIKSLAAAIHVYREILSSVLIFIDIAYGQPVFPPLS